MKWKKINDGGWLQDEPAYESEDGKYFIARDYDDEFDETQKTMWFLHKVDDKGNSDFIQAFDRLKDAKAYCD